MTRSFARRLLMVGRMTVVIGAVTVLTMVAAACSSSSAASQPASGQVPAAAPSGADQGSPASAGTVDRTSARYGVAPDRTLPGACLMSVAEAETLIHVSGLITMVNQHGVCSYLGSKGTDGPGIMTSLVSDFGVSGLPVVIIPPGAPFDLAYVWTSSGLVQAAAHVKGQVQWVLIAASDSAMSRQALVKAMKTGLQNIMYWWPRSAVTAPSTPTPKVSASVDQPTVAGKTCYDQVWNVKPAGTKAVLTQLEVDWAKIADTANNGGGDSVIKAKARQMLADVAAAWKLSMPACSQELTTQYHAALTHFQNAARLFATGGYSNFGSSQSEQDAGSKIEETFGMNLQP